ncbi:MAG: hypothetical protein KBT34_10375 [Prevotella sp.]|nr:hypothetical protein [Candidatus Prevotella equi]
MVKINLSLKTVYFDAINRGIKKTEYRDGTPYYVEKLVDMSKYPGLNAEQILEELRKGAKLYPKKIDAIVFHNNQRVLTMEVKGIEVYDHHTSFAIKLGKRIN